MKWIRFFIKMLFYIPVIILANYIGTPPWSWISFIIGFILYGIWDIIDNIV